MRLHIPACTCHVAAKPKPLAAGLVRPVGAGAAAAARVQGHGAARAPHHAGGRARHRQRRDHQQLPGRCAAAAHPCAVGRLHAQAGRRHTLQSPRCLTWALTWAHACTSARGLITSLSAAPGNTGSGGADEGARTSAMLPGGLTATNPAGDMRALATSLPALVRIEPGRAAGRGTTPAALSVLCSKRRPSGSTDPCAAGRCDKLSDGDQCSHVLLLTRRRQSWRPSCRRWRRSCCPPSPPA
jgi:hypothetical protein